MNPPTRARPRQQPDETRTLILDTAEELLRTRPFRELSVDEVMRPTGYGRTVFYRHFTGLPDLVLAVLTRVLPTFAAATEAFVRAAGEPCDLDTTRDLLRPVVTSWAQHGALMRAMRDAAVYDSEIDAVVRATYDRFHDRIVEALEHRRRSTGLLAEADLDQLGWLLSAMNQRYLLVTFGEREDSDPEVALETLALGWLSVLNAP